MEALKSSNTKKKKLRRSLCIAAAVVLVVVGIFIASSCDFLYQFGPGGFLEQLSDYGVNPALDGYKQLDADLRGLAAFGGSLYAFGPDGIYEINEASFEIAAVYPMSDQVDFGMIDARQTRGRWYVAYDAADEYFLMNSRYLDAPLIRAGLSGTLTYASFLTGEYYGNIGDGYEFSFDPAIQTDLFNTYDSAVQYGRTFPYEFINFQWSEDDSLLYLMTIEWGDPPKLRIAQIPRTDFGAGVIDYPYGYEDFAIELPAGSGGDSNIWARTDGEKHAAVFLDESIYVYTLDGKLLYKERLWEQGTAALSSGGEFLFVMKEDHSSDSSRVKISKYRLVP